MAINEFLSFATGAGANVLSQADYDALSARIAGFQSGTAKSAQVNKAIRQAAFIAAAMGKFAADNSGADSLDNGDLSAFLNNFKLALQLFIGSAGYGIDTGTANAYAVAFSPAVTALSDGMVVKFKAQNANTGASTFNPSGLGARPIVSNSGAALSSGMIPANGDIWLQYNSSIGTGSWVLLAGQNFGNAALATIMASMTDTTSGRLMPNGAWNLGSTYGGSDVDPNAIVATQFFRAYNSANLPTLNTFNGLHIQREAGGRATRLLFDTDSREFYIQFKNASGAWQSPAKIFGSNNVSPFIQTLLDDADAASAQTTLNGFGYNQTWQDVTASRALGTTYTNTSGRPIEVFINLDDNGAQVGVTININGISWTTTDPGGQAFMAPSFVVPPGNTYSITGGSTLRKWLELR